MNKLVTSLTKDLSKGAARIISNPKVISTLDENDRDELKMKFLNYAPKTAIGSANRERVLQIVNEAAGYETATVDALDAEEIGKKETALLYIKVPMPSLTKCIDSKLFTQNAVKKFKGEFKDDEKIDYKRHTIVQKLFDKQYTKPFLSQRIEFLGWLGRHAIPSDFIEKHHFLVPKTLIPVVIDKIEALIIEREELLKAFAAKYEEAKIDAKTRLGIHYDESRYANFSEIKAKFEIDHPRWRSIDPAAALKDISKSEYEKQRKLGRMDWENTFAEVRTALRNGFADLVNGFTDALGADDDGKLHIFHGSKVDHIKEFISTFAARDLTDDKELAEVAEKAKMLLDNVDPANIRKDKDLRTQLEGSFKEIKTMAEKLMVPKVRRLNLDDE